MTRRRLVLIAALNPKAGSFRIHTLLMARALCEAFDVALVSDKLYPFTTQERNFFPEDQLPDLFDEFTFFDLHHERDNILLYQLGNNDHYGWILDRFFMSPGLVLVHDPSFYWLLSSNPLLRENFIDEEVGLLTSIMLRKSMGWDRPELASISSHTIYFNRCVLQYAVGILCHSSFQMSKFKVIFPEKLVDCIDLIPNFLEDTAPMPPLERLKIRDRLSIPDSCTVFSILGYQSFHKRIVDLLSAFCTLDASLNIRLVMAGRWDALLKANCSGYLETLLARKWLILIDEYVSESDLEFYISASDVVINLRYPTAGESSGIACQALALGTPVLVNTIGAFVDLPVEAVYRLPFSNEGSEVTHIAGALHNIVADQHTLEGKQAAARMLSPNFSMSRYRNDYVNAIKLMTKTYSEARDNVERQLGVRAHNDVWPTRLRHHPVANIVVIGDDSCNAISVANPMFGAAETMALIHEDMKRMNSKFQMKSKKNTTSFKELAAEICKFRDMNFVNLTENSELLQYSGHLFFASDVGCMSLTKDQYLSLIKRLPIGARIYVTDNFVMAFGLVEGPNASEIAAAFTAYAQEEKSNLETAVFRYGLNFLNPVEVGGQRFHVLRKSSNVYDFYAGPSLKLHRV